MNNKFKLRSEIKKDVINYYDELRSDIDVRSQQLMSTCSNDPARHGELVDLNLSLIERVETLFEQNIREINEFDFEKAGADSDRLKALIFTGYCAFVASDSFKKQSELDDLIDIGDRDFQIGILVETDRYLDKNQLNYLKIKLEKNVCQRSIEFNLDENVLSLMYAFKEKQFRKSKHSMLISKIHIQKELAKLSKLNLVFNKEEKNLIKKIENNSFIHLSSLKELSLCDNIAFVNELRAGECLFNGLDTLQVFNLSLMTNMAFMNDISKNNSLVNLNCLKELNISNNELIALKRETFSELTNLERLLLIDCSIRWIEASAFETMKKLDYLNLSHNRLAKLGRQTFAGLDNLNRLVLTWSSIRQIDNFAFENLRKLVKLDLSYNKLEQTLNENTFYGLANLKHLYLSNYSMRLLEANTFRMLKSLRTLDLSNHRIEILKPHCFNGLSNLIELNLSTGRIQIVEPNTFNSLKKLRYLYIYENPFRVDDKYVFQNEHDLKCLERINFKKLLPVYKKKRHIFVLKCELAMLVYYLLVFFIRLIFY